LENERYSLEPFRGFDGHIENHKMQEIVQQFEKSFGPDDDKGVYAD